MKRLLAVAGAILLAAMLSGCVNFDNPAVKNADEEVNDKGQQFVDQLGQFTLADLNQAMVLTGDADLNGTVDNPGGDQLADSCYFYLAGKVGTSADRPTVAGVVSGFQLARNLKRQGGFSDEFKGACGGLIMDVRLNVLRGASGFLPGFGGISGILN